MEDRKTLIDLKQVYEDLTKCSARVKLLFVDACRNDPRTKASRSRGHRELDLQRLNAPQRLKPPKGVAAFFSCQAGQESFEDKDNLGHGVFFHFVLEGLRGKAASDGKVTLPDLQSYVRKNVKSYVHQHFSRQIQKPQLTSAVEDVITLAFGDKIARKPDKPAKVTEGGAVPDKSAKATKEITNSIGMKFRLVPASTFMMGSPKDEKDRQKDEGPQHEVEITRPFHMGVYEVTQAEYRKVMGKSPSHFNEQKVAKATSSFPVEQVSWNDAVEFCKKLSVRVSHFR